MTPQLLLPLLFLANGLLLAGLAVPLIRGRVPRNPWYGFRVEKTLASDEVWYAANRFMGKDLLWCGVVLAVGSGLLAGVASHLTVDGTAYLGLALTMVPLAIMVVRSFRYLNTL